MTDMSYTFKTPVRAPFLTVFDPKAFMRNGKSTGEPKYSATILIPDGSPELGDVKSAIMAAAKAKWPSRALTELAFPLSTGAKAAEKATAKGKDGSFNLGHMTLTARSKFPPILSVLEGGRIVTLDNDGLKAKYKGKFYGGCFVSASVNFVPYDAVKDGDKDGITAYLQSVLWIKDGERIGGRDQAEIFKMYAGQTTEEDPMGDDGGIPF